MYMCGGSNNNAMVFSRPYDGDSHTSSVVDCTLSLGPPATRLTGDYDRGSSSSHHERRPSSPNWSASFCWDILQNTAAVTPSHKANLGGGNGGASAADPLHARRCANCDTTSTPLWRNGPRGRKSLCNACGIRFKKEERRANAAASGGEMAETHHYQPMINGNPWAHHSQSTHKRSSCYSTAAAAAAKGSEFRFRDDVDDRDSTFLSWRLNVTDRAGLVHGFTR